MRHCVPAATVAAATAAAAAAVASKGPLLVCAATASNEPAAGRSVSQCFKLGFACNVPLSCYLNYFCKHQTNILFVTITIIFAGPFVVFQIFLTTL